MSARAKWRSWFWAGAVAFYLALWLFFSQYPEVFFAGDMGLKFLQIQNLARGRLEIGYPGQTLDPEFEYFPFVSYVLKSGEKVTTAYLNPFVYLAVPFYKAGGWTGLFFLPCLVTVLILILSFRISSLLTGFPPYLSVVLLGLCSPLLFLSAVLQEYTLCACLVLAAVASLAGEGGLELVPKRCFFSGVFLALAILTRQEAVLVAVAWLLTVFLIEKETSSRLKAVAGVGGGILAVIIPYLMLELALYGRVLEAEKYGMLHTWYRVSRGKWLGLRFYCLFHFLFGLVNMVGEERYPCLSLPLLLSLAIPVIPRLRKNHFLSVLGIWLALLALLGVLGAVVFGRLWVRGLLYTTPYLILMVFFARPLAESTPAKFLLSVSFYYFLFVIVTAPNVGGLQWGPRYLIPIYPCLVMVTGFCWTNRSRLPSPRLRRHVAVAGVLLAIFSLLVQAKGLSVLYRKKSGQSAARVVDKLDTDAWLTYLFYFPQEAAARYYNGRMFFLPPARESFLTLIERVNKSGGTSFALVGLRGHPIQKGLTLSIESATSFRREGEGIPFKIYDLDLEAVLYRKKAREI